MSGNEIKISFRLFSVSILMEMLSGLDACEDVSGSLLDAKGRKQEKRSAEENQ